MPKCWTNKRTERLKLKYFYIGHGRAFWFIKYSTFLVFSPKSHWNTSINKPNSKLYIQCGTILFKHFVINIPFDQLFLASPLNIKKTVLLNFVHVLWECVLLCFLLILLFIMCICSFIEKQNIIQQQQQVWRFSGLTVHFVQLYECIVWQAMWNLSVFFRTFYLRCINCLRSQFIWI